jgi:glycosyltransferase involved in cell wall biosynthesis
VIHLLPFSGFKGYFLNNFALHTLIKKISPDVTNVHFATGYGVLAMLSRIRPYILSVWGSDVYVAPYRSFLHKWLVKRSLNSACHIASTSHAMAEQVRLVLGKPQDVSVTPFGVDMDKFQNTHPIFDNQNITIGIVKTLEPVYAINILVSGFAKTIELLATVPELQSKLRLMIVGDGSQKNELTELVKHHQIEDKVDFVGRVPNCDVPKFINQMDIFAITSKVESFGVAAVEASACERPCIVSNVGGLTEVVLDEHTGLVVEFGNDDQLAQAIVNLVSNKSKAIAFGINGREHVAQIYSEQQALDTMRTLLLRYCRKHD